jgi:uncharacterized protein YjbI with pentapeptide repeats
VAGESKPWSPRPPDEDNATFRRLAGTRIISVEPERPDLADAVVVDCDFGGVVVTDGALRRVRAERTRFRDSVCAGAMVQDAHLSDCQITTSSLRFATLQRVVFTDCVLTGLDLYGVRFDRVRFERCDLSGADFSAAVVKSLRLAECNLFGVRGALALRGAEVDLEDVAALAPSLAAEVGLVIRGRAETELSDRDET